MVWNIDRISGPIGILVSIPRIRLFVDVRALGDSALTSATGFLPPHAVDSERFELTMLENIPWITYSSYSIRIFLKSLIAVLGYRRISTMAAI